MWLWRILGLHHLSVRVWLLSLLMFPSDHWKRCCNSSANVPVFGLCLSLQAGMSEAAIHCQIMGDQFLAPHTAATAMFAPHNALWPATPPFISISLLSMSSATHLFSSAWWPWCAHCRQSWKLQTLHFEWYAFNFWCHPYYATAGRSHCVKSIVPLIVHLNHCHSALLVHRPFHVLSFPVATIFCSTCSFNVPLLLHFVQISFLKQKSSALWPSLAPLLHFSATGDSVGCKKICAGTFWKEVSVYFVSQLHLWSGFPKLQWDLSLWANVSECVHVSVHKQIYPLMSPNWQCSYSFFNSAAYVLTPLGEKNSCLVGV